jgi:hypothetical protein
MLTSYRRYVLSRRESDEGRCLTIASSMQSKVRIQASFIFTDFAPLQADKSTEPFTIQPGSKYVQPSFNKSEAYEYSENLFKDSAKMHYWRRLELYRDEKAEKAFRQQGRLATAAWMNMPLEKVPDKDVAHFNNAAIM